MLNNYYKKVISLHYKFNHVLLEDIEEIYKIKGSSVEKNVYNIFLIEANV